AELGFPSDLVNLWGETLEKVFTTGVPGRVEFQLPGGMWIDWLLVPEFFPDGSVETVLTAARDITDRKIAEEAMKDVHRSLEARVEERTAELVGANQELRGEIAEREEAEEALLHSEETLRLIVEGSPGFFFYVHDPEGLIIYISPSVRSITGRSMEEWMAHYTTYLTDNPINKKVVEYTERTMRGEASRINYPAEIEHADGRRIFLDLYERPIIKDGKVVGIQGVAHDITESRRRQRELIRLSSALAGLVEMVIITDMDHRIIYANTASRELLGYYPEELIGRDSREIFDKVPGNPPNLTELIRQEVVKGVWKGEVFDRKKDGTIISVAITMTGLKDEDGKEIGWVGISSDVTHRRQLEEQLRHAQKMEAIGTLAGGIAHDFNNILAGITGYAFLAKQKLKRSDPIFANLGSIERLSRRGAELTRSLLAFSRRGEFQPGPVDINRIAEEVLEIIRRRTGEKIPIRAELEKELPNISGEERLLHQILMNVCVNACDAMPEGGILALSTSRISPDQVVSSLLAESGVGDLIMIKISDTGIGMDDEMKSRIFEPFFSTKDDKSGTGLGLSIVNGIVEKHGGWIEVESTPGLGSEFTIYLPITGEVNHSSG
ncbi:MAG TPA: PAS domain S-box protein, partial [Proteobacteria bacterium]|nr:PAS domain S-box protein [Pseudomonadota bacterium]